MDRSLAQTRVVCRQSECDIQFSLTVLWNAHACLNANCWIRCPNRLNSSWLHVRARLGIHHVRNPRPDLIDRLPAVPKKIFGPHATWCQKHETGLATTVITCLSTLEPNRDKVRSRYAFRIRNMISNSVYEETISITDTCDGATQRNTMSLLRRSPSKG